MFPKEFIERLIHLGSQLGFNGYYPAEANKYSHQGCAN